MINPDRWLENGYNDAQDDEDELNEQIADLLNGKFNPHLSDNISEALANDCLIDHLPAFVEALENRNDTALGAILRASIYEYWENAAEIRVRGNI